MAPLNEEDLDRAIAELDDHHQVLDLAPPKSQLLGPFTVVCLFLNRTIGSGIFIQPAYVLDGTRSIGAALLLWAFGAFVATCGLLVWLELGMTIPIHEDPQTGEKKSVPRSGGEKNYWEYLVPKPKFLATSSYGILFIVLGNLAGNAVMVGIYILKAAGQDPTANGTRTNAAVTGLAIGAVTLSVGLHMFSRRGGILVNNIFAVAKVSILIVLIVLGFIKAGCTASNSCSRLFPHGTGKDLTTTSNFNHSFQKPPSDPVSFIDSCLYIFYSFSGFLQPFYVLSEVANPRKVLPRYTLIAMLFTSVLFILVNVSYLSVVRIESLVTSPSQPPTVDLPAIFFGGILGHRAEQAMDALIAFSVFGSLLVMTFTAGRVKQEIAKEGILPFSRFFATGQVTPLAWLRIRGRSTQEKSLNDNNGIVERAPIAGLGLHWFASVVVVLVTCMLGPSRQYQDLVYLYTYSSRVLIAFLVSGGLLYVKILKAHRWSEVVNFKSWIDPFHAIILFVVSGTLLFASFAEPAVSVVSKTNPKWYVMSTIALSSLFWGVLWWAGLRGLEKYRRKELVVTRLPFIVEGTDGQYIQKAEIVEYKWRAVLN